MARSAFVAAVASAQRGEVPATSTCTRRDLGRLAALAAATCGSAALLPREAFADRTGRFSTRLTARRRYLPRVRAGVEAVRARAEGDVSGKPMADLVADLLPPAKLLASGSVGEGAAAAPTRVRLKEALDVVERSGPRADKDPAALQALLDALDEYEDAVGLSDTLPAS